MTTHLTHWGAFTADSDGARLTSVKPWHGDPEPAPLIDNIASAQHHATRIDRPYVRRGWLEHGPGAPGRGDDPYVPLDWEPALDLLSGELRRIYDTHGPGSVFGGSYGWASAGRFHHGQSQVHRFLNSLGGYVRHRNSYSFGTAQVLLPHVLGTFYDVIGGATGWDVLTDHTELVVAFGGISAKNSQVAPGGVSKHGTRSRLAALRAAGCRVVSVSPLADDTPPEADAEWLAPRPGSDAALMLALAYVLDAEELADRDFLDRFTTGYDRFMSYVRGDVDGVAKTPGWASGITGVEADAITGLARRMAGSRTLVTVSWSLQRTRFGEQPLWLGIVLAAMLGQFGLPGGGFGFGYGSSSDVGTPSPVSSPPALPQGHNPVKTFIPVARIADMLLNPGTEYQYNGQTLTYPDIRLVYWCGGNPFHHHQDLARLRRAFARPETVVVHDPFWTASARHADFVLPATMSIERDDYGAGSNDPRFMPMPALTRPHGQARDDYDIFADLAHRCGAGDGFTEGRDTTGWLRHLYDQWRERLTGIGHDLPSFDEFWAGEYTEIPVPKPRQVFLDGFRADPRSNRLRTPSGRIEIFSETIDGFGYPDCPGHPVWREPEDWAQWSDVDLHLIANQPKTKLHSQLDVGEHSRSHKINDREPARIHPDDAAAHGLSDGDIAILRNPQGSCLVGIRVSDRVLPGVVQLSTGAWYDPDPDDPSHCRHGNPNVLVPDRPTSPLSQGSTGQHARVSIAKYTGEPAALAVLTAPETTEVS